MDKVKLQELIKKIQYEVSDIRSLNCGGCGFFALFVTEEFEKLGIKSKIAIIDPSNKTVTARKRELNRLTNGEDYDKVIIQHSAFVHCIVKVQGIYFDGHRTGLERITGNFWGTYEKRGYYTKEEMKVSLQYGGWNSMFSRSQTPKLRKDIQQAFEKVLGKKKKLSYIGKLSKLTIN